MQRATVTVVMLLLSCACAVDFRNNEFTKFYQSLDDELKAPFLRYHLAEGALNDNEIPMTKLPPLDRSVLSPGGLGMSDDMYKKIQSLSPPDGFTERVYELAKYEMGLTRHQVVRLLRESIVCDGHGHCWDIGDVGSNCCP